MTEKDQTLLDQQARGERAAIAAKELEGAFKALDEDIYATFIECDVDDAEAQQLCKLYAWVMDDVKQRFFNAVVTGENARKELVRKPKAVAV